MQRIFVTIGLLAAACGAVLAPGKANASAASTEVGFTGFTNIGQLTGMHALTFQDPALGWVAVNPSMTTHYYSNNTVSTSGTTGASLKNGTATTITQSPSPYLTFYADANDNNSGTKVTATINVGPAKAYAVSTTTEDYEVAKLTFTIVSLPPGGMVSRIGTFSVGQTGS